MDTEDLLSIWLKKDRKEWTAEALIAVERILLARLGELPRKKEEPRSLEPHDDPRRIEQATQVLYRVDAFLDKEDFEQALEACQEAIQLAPHMAEAYSLRGLVFDGLGRLADAIDSYREAVRLDPHHEEAQQNLSEALLELEKEGNYPQARQHLEQAIDLVDEGEFENALNECDLVIQAYPGFAEAYNYKGIIQMEMKQVAEAIDSFWTAVRLDPELFAARRNLSDARVAWREEEFLRIYRGEFEIQHLDGTFHPASEEIGEFSLFDFLKQELEYIDAEDPEAPAFYLGANAILQPGWPGYRNQPRRMGLDPLHSNFELSYLEGVMIRRLFTGRFRSYNLIYLFFMFLTSLYYALPVLPIIIILLNYPSIPLFIFLLSFMPFYAIGAALIYNIVLSLLTWNTDRRDSIPSDDAC
jgi:tetratricopeptide (TPR) repeat protein